MIRQTTNLLNSFWFCLLFLLRGVRIGEADVGGGEVRYVCALFGRINI